MSFSELIVVYLFCGGSAAGAFALYSLIEIWSSFHHPVEPFSQRLPKRYIGARASTLANKMTAQLVYGISFVMLLVGMVCLLADLGRPEEFYLLILYPTESLISLGTYALMGLILCVFIVLLEALLTLRPVWEKIALVVKAVGIVAAVIVMIYTGLLLENTIAIHLWQSGWLPILFLMSSLSCGCAIVLLSVRISEPSRESRSWLRGLSFADAIFIVLEMIVIVLFAITVNTTRNDLPFNILLFGQQAPLFWCGVVVCGLVVPLIVEMVSLLSRRERSGNIVTILAILILVGGFSLRFVLVSAGIQVEG